LSHDELASKLEAGAETVKSIYRSVRFGPVVAWLTISELPNYDIIIPALLKGGVDGLKENCRLTPGTCSRWWEIRSLT
jgi:DNA ligase-1